MHSTNSGRSSFGAVLLPQAVSMALPSRVYWVTLRLADALPKNMRSAATQRLMDHSLQHRATNSIGPSDRLAGPAPGDGSRYLGAGSGSCALARPDIAEIVASALAYSDGCGYHLKAWCIMPNHVHAVLRMSACETLARAVKSWKAFTAKRARRILRSDGNFWEPNHYERALRTEGQIAAAVDYVLASPRRGSLTNWPWVWSDRLLDAASDPEPLPPMPVRLAADAVHGVASL